MPSKPRNKIAPQQEETPYTIALSYNEVVALVRWHTSQAKRVTKAFGQAALQERACLGFSGRRNMTALADQAKAMLETHSLRAKGLISILPER